MPVLFAITAETFSSFVKGVALAVSVYLTSRGV